MDAERLTEPQYSEESENSASLKLSATNCTWPDLATNSDRRGEKPACSLLAYGALLRLHFVFPQPKVFVDWKGDGFLNSKHKPTKWN
jgi:hypothetical protein